MPGLLLGALSSFFTSGRGGLCTSSALSERLQLVAAWNHAHPDAVDRPPRLDGTHLLGAGYEGPRTRLGLVVQPPVLRTESCDVQGNSCCVLLRHVVLVSDATIVEGELVEEVNLRDEWPRSCSSRSVSLVSVILAIFHLMMVDDDVNRGIGVRILGRHGLGNHLLMSNLRKLVGIARAHNGVGEISSLGVCKTHLDIFLAELRRHLGVDGLQIEVGNISVLRLCEIHVDIFISHSGKPIGIARA